MCHANSCWFLSSCVWMSHESTSFSYRIRISFLRWTTSWQRQATGKTIDGNVLSWCLVFAYLLITQDDSSFLSSFLFCRPPSIIFYGKLVAFSQFRWILSLCHCPRLNLVSCIWRIRRISTKNYVQLSETRLKRDRPWDRKLENGCVRCASVFISECDKLPLAFDIEKENDVRVG